MFGLSLFMWWVLGTGLVRFLAYLKRMAVGIIQYKANINQPLNMDNYKKFIATRQLEDEDIDLVTLRGALSIPTTRQCPYARPPDPSS